MSKYTTEVRFICETYSGLSESEGYHNIDGIIQNALPKIFDFDFPIYDEDYRSVLETKIIKHYYTREIGAETVGLWKHFLCTKMNEIMPYYNKLYESAILAYNPLYDVDYRREGNKQGTEDNNTSTTTNGSNASNETVNRSVSLDGDEWDTYSDTPQGGLAGVRNENYLTNARHIDTDNETTEDGTRHYVATNQQTGTGHELNTSTDKYLEHVYGKTSGTSYSKMIEEYRATLINIDLMVIDELADLFFNLW